MLVYSNSVIEHSYDITPSESKKHGINMIRTELEYLIEIQSDKNNSQKLSWNF